MAPDIAPMPLSLVDSPMNNSLNHDSHRDAVLVALRAALGDLSVNALGEPLGSPQHCVGIEDVVTARACEHGQWKPEVRGRECVSLLQADSRSLRWQHASSVHRRERTLG